jgi:flavin reductase (DIM6/NTAB) family NADH-FMN oxidoreductase RutF
VQKVVKVGNSSGRQVDKFKAFALTPLPASLVAPPLVAECYANLECRVADAAWVNKYNFFVLEVVKAWIDPVRKNPRILHHEGRGIFRVSGRTLKLPSRMK